MKKNIKMHEIGWIVWQKKLLLSISCIFFWCGITGLADAQTGLANLWTLSSTWGFVEAQGFGYPGLGWIATSGLMNSDGSYHILWTKENQNIASLWTITASGGWGGARGFGGPGSGGWTATSYFKNCDGSYHILWTKNRLAQVWSFTPTGGWGGARGFGGPGSAGEWTATSYFKNSDGSYHILWTKEDQNIASLWTITASGGWGGARGFGGPASGGWTATSYFKNSDGSYHFLWTKNNLAMIFNLTASNGWGGAQGFGGPSSGGWTATCFERRGACGASLKTSILAESWLLVKKAGSGAGTISTALDVCPDVCTEFSIPYVEGKKADLEVAASAGSYFTGWETAGGVHLENIYYANPGETVFAIFERK